MNHYFKQTEYAAHTLINALIHERRQLEALDERLFAKRKERKRVLPLTMMTIPVSIILGPIGAALVAVFGGVYTKKQM